MMETSNGLILKHHVANEKIPEKYIDFFPSITSKEGL